MRRRAIIAATLGFAFLAGSEVSAQTSTWGPNGYLGLNGIYQGSTLTFGQDVRIDLNQEEGQVNSGHEVGPGPGFDVFGGGRIIGNFGFGFGVSVFERAGSAAVTASLPHPFFFNQPRQVAGQADDLGHKELAVHFDAMWLFPLTDTVQVIAFGGPSYFQVKQDLVTNVRFVDEYPYDEATFSRAESLQQQGSELGFNAGVDVTVFFSQYVGVGTLVRFSRARVTVGTEDNRKADVDVGGLQVGGGVRFRF